MPIRRGAGTVALLLLLGLSACTTYRGVTEFGAYREAYSAATAVGNDILDRVAVAERSLHATAFPFDPMRSGFDPGLAAYYVDSVDPPLTASWRRMVTAVALYNDALHGLASGAEAAAIAGRISRLGLLGTQAATDAAALAGAAPGSALAGIAARAGAIDTAIAAFAPLATQAIALRTRARFREDLLANAPAMALAIAEARASTTRLFELLQGAIVTRANADPARFGTLTEAEAAEIARLRSLLAAWVILLDASAEALDAALAASGDQGPGSFEGMLMASTDLAAAVREARLTLAGTD